MDIQKRPWKNDSLIQNHMWQERSESARERRLVSYKSDQQQQIHWMTENKEANEGLT